MDWSVLMPVASIITAVAGTGAGLGWWLSGQFVENRKFTYQIVKEMKEEVLKKLEYHEKHDDLRFGQIDSRFGRIRNDIWEIRLQQAAKDGYIKKTKSNEENEDDGHSRPEV